MANHVFAHAGLADVDAELEQFAMDAWRAPEWFSRLKLADQFANLFRNAPPPALAASNFPGPEQP